MYINTLGVIFSPISGTFTPSKSQTRESPKNGILLVADHSRAMTNDRQEIEVEEGTVSFTPREQHWFDAQYTVFFNKRFEEVADQLTTRDFRVLIAMLRFCDYGNNIHTSRSALSRHTGIAVNHISSIIRRLERLRIIIILERGARYRINERYFWRGSAESHGERRRETRRQRESNERID